MRSGSLNILPQNGHSNGMMSPMPGAHRFDGPRSPPNTSHVPCKFFRQGACQAGNACPFSHDLGAAAENVCKYFAKGNCKFGPKCANIHILPDGRRINYGKNGVTIGVAPINLGSRVNPSTYHHPSNSALTNSFMRGDNVPAYTATSPYAIPSDDRYGHQLGRQPSIENGLPTIDTTYSSNPASVYGSPRDEDANRFGLGLSPVTTKGLSVLDAPLPASFDSNGISHAARYGPWPASVPSKFGLESPSASLSAAKDGRTSETLKLLHTSAFGSSEHLGSSGLGSSDTNGYAMGSSPPVGSGNSRLVSTAGAGGAGDEYFGKRAMHSSSLRYAKPRLLSSSAPKIDRDWEAEFLFEEDYVPGALANEVLTPAEKARRGSTTNTLRGLDDASDSLPISMAMGTATPAAATAKFGSPAASSPSRWGLLFQRQKEDEQLLEIGNGSFGGGGSTSRSMKHAAASAFGHVGSPLRNSSLASGIGSELMNGSGSESSPARPGSGGRTGGGGNGESLSVLTQQLRRTGLADDNSNSSSPRLHPSHATRNSSGSLAVSLGGGLGAISKMSDRERGLERHVSSGSIGSSVTGRFTTPIDEEETSFVFSMEEMEGEEEPSMSAGSGSQVRTRKRVSGGVSIGVSATGPPLGSTWSYAAAVAGKKAATGGVVGGGGVRDGVTAVETVGGR